jgi:hypothetical protein
MDGKSIRVTLNESGILTHNNLAGDISAGPARHRTNLLYWVSMRTTVEIPDGLYPVIASASEASGQTIAAFVIEAAKEKAAQLAIRPNELDFEGWWNSFGKADTQSAAEVQRIIDDEFSDVRPEDWA